MKKNSSSSPIFFNDQFEFRNWLETHHLIEKELVAGFYKTGSGKPTMTWSESVDQAICFGWIDGVRKSLDDERYTIRFTPRNPRSNWSQINIKKAETLIASGLMKPAGLTAYEKRKTDEPAEYSYENKPLELPEEMMEMFKADETAWNFFTLQPQSYQKTVLYWILSAKQEKTQLSRLFKAIDGSRQLKRI